MGQLLGNTIKLDIKQFKSSLRKTFIKTFFIC